MITSRFDSFHRHGTNDSIEGATQTTVPRDDMKQRAMKRFTAQKVTELDMKYSVAEWKKEIIGK